LQSEEASIRVLLCQASDQHTNLIGDLRPTVAWPGFSPSVDTETGTVPAGNGLGLHDDKDVGPAGPNAAEGRPEEPVHRVQCWPRPFAFEDRDLLSEGEEFEGGIASTAEEDADGGEE
jgi:hypothetical protein